MLELKHVSYTYPSRKQPAVVEADLQLAPREHLVLVGVNGSGKSTLARLAAGSLLAESGSVVIDGEDPASSADARDTVAQLVGYVRQDPRDQLVCSSVRDEVAFGPCNLGLSPDAVRRRCDEALAACGLAEYSQRSCEELSGGQTQRLALAGVLTLRPRYLVLDEASAFLDSRARTELAQVIEDTRAAGCGILSVSHSLADVVRATRVGIVEAGRLAWEGTPHELLADAQLMARAQLGDAPLATLLPDLMAAGFDPRDLTSPQAVLSFVTAQGMLERLRELLSVWGTRVGTNSSVASLELHDAYAYYQDTAALDGMNLKVPTGEITLMAGVSGSGKTTALCALAGVGKLDRGQALLRGASVHPGQVGLAFQRPEEQLFCATVLEDVAAGPRAQGASASEAHDRAGAALGQLGVASELWERSPWSLSGGQARRVALAGIIAMRLDAYTFDEPSAGLDAAGRAALRALLSDLAGEGAAVCVVSHDLDDLLNYVNSVALVAYGKTLWQGSTPALMADATPLSMAGLTPPVELVLQAALAGGERDGAHKLW